MPYRAGNHWGRTLVWEGSGEPDEDGRRPDDMLLGVLDTPELTHRVAYLLNQDDDEEGPYEGLLLP